MKKTLCSLLAGLSLFGCRESPKIDGVYDNVSINGPGNTVLVDYDGNGTVDVIALSYKTGKQKYLAICVAQDMVRVLKPVYSIDEDGIKTPRMTAEIREIATNILKQQKNLFYRINSELKNRNIKIGMR